MIKYRYKTNDEKVDLWAISKEKNEIRIPLFPESIDDYISDDNSVCVIEEYVEQLDMEKLDFKKSRLSVNGQASL